MDANAIMTVSAAVVGLSQVLKSAVPDRFGLLTAAVLSVLGVWLWGWSHDGINRATAFDYFTGWIAVLTSAAGVFGILRAAPEQVMALKKTPMVVLLAGALVGLSACAPTPAPAVPANTQQTIRVMTVRVADQMSLAVTTVQQIAAIADLSTLTTARKDAIDCAIVKLMGTTGGPSAATRRVCGVVPAGEGPLVRATRIVGTVTSRAELEAAVAVALEQLGPLLDQLQASESKPLAALAAVLRATVGTTLAILGGTS